MKWEIIYFEVSSLYTCEGFAWITRLPRFTGARLRIVAISAISPTCVAYAIDLTNLTMNVGMKFPGHGQVASVYQECKISAINFQIISLNDCKG